MQKNTLKNRKSDNIVWDETQEKYIAKLLPYASQVNSPLIEVPNVDAFKKKGVDKVSKQFNAELVDLKKKITQFVKEASDTQKVYSAKFKFEPLVGEVYFLYFGKKENYLSLIPPENWKKEFIGAFRLNSEYKWEQVDWKATT